MPGVTLLGDAAYLAYEKDLLPRSASAAVEADELQKLLFGDNEPQSLVDTFTHNQPIK